MAYNTTKKVRDRLKEEYQRSDRTRQMRLLNMKREFKSTSTQKDETTSRYADRISLIVNNIRLLDEDFSHKRIVEKVLVTLFEIFKSKFSFLEESKDLGKISLTELMSALQAQEQGRALRQDRVSEGAFHVQNNKQEKKRCYSTKRIKERTTNSDVLKQKKSPSCTHYKKTTHLEKYYWWRPETICGNYKQLGHITNICKFNNKESKPQSA